jgi:predicted metalloprotease with PDZ domain
MSWRDWQRFEDYYAEGQLVWLDVDTLIRERSQGKRSLG